jgi:hypothetical protein
MSTRIGGHRAEVLIERLGAAVELDAVEVVRPEADTELVEPELLVRRRLDRGLDRAAAGAPAARLIDDIGREVPAQENGLKALAAVRRGLPCLGELARAMPHDDRVFSGAHRNLVEGVGVVAMIGLARRLQRLLGIEDARRRRHRPTHGETALLLDLPAR